MSVVPFVPPHPSTTPTADAIGAGEVHPPRWSAFVEIALYIAAVLALDAVWGSGDRFRHVEPHPFWGIVLLMAVHYGTAPALIATAASSVALLVGNLPPQSFDQNVHDYSVEVLVRPLLWMVASLVLGELRMRQKLQHHDTVERLRNTERQVTLLSRAHKDLTSAKERLETRLAGQLRTATGLFEAARMLETLDPGKVIAGAIDLVSTALQARSFSLFLLEGDALLLAATKGESERERTERYTGSSRLFQAVVGGQHVVSVANPEGEAILNGEGLIAGPLIDPGTGRLIGMLRIEEMAFLDFNLSTLQTFRTMCEWVGAAYANALTHQDNQIEDAATRLYGMKFLDRQADYVTELALRFGFDLTLLLFRVDVDDLPERERMEMPAILGEVARRVLRRTDMVFSHEPPGTQFAVLLPGAPPEHVSAVAKKLRDALIERVGHDVSCTTRVRGLCRAGEKATRNSLRASSIEQDLVA